jgi:hypothetical protein
MLVSMNISDLLGQGNPDGEEGVLWLGEERNTSYTSQKSDKSSSRASKMTFLIVGIVALSAVASLGIGYLAGGQGSGAGLVVSSIPMTHPTSSLVTASVFTAGVGAASSSTGSIPSGGEVVGDSSVHTYFLPWCKQTAQISKAHTVWFATEQAAKSAGYAAGKACSGI